MITCCKVENCVGKGSVFWGYGAAVWGILGIWCCSVGYFEGTFCLLQWSVDLYSTLKVNENW